VGCGQCSPVGGMASNAPFSVRFCFNNPGTEATTLTTTYNGVLTADPKKTLSATDQEQVPAGPGYACLPANGYLSVSNVQSGQWNVTAKNEITAPANCAVTVPNTLTIDISGDHPPQCRR